MNQSKKKSRSYIVVARLVAQWAENWDSSIVRIGEYKTLAEAEEIAARIIPSRHAKNHRPKKNHEVVEIRIELYRRTAKGITESAA